MEHCFALGHKSIEAEALEVIEAVRSEPAAVEPEPQAKATRKRRSKAEIEADRAAQPVVVSIDGTRYEGSPHAIAAVVKAMAA